ncbi:MAG: multiheme c-type cytochrome [Sandaracinaceae bacterium]
MSNSSRTPRRRLAYAPLAVAALTLLTGSGGSCSEERRPTTTPDPSDETVQAAALPPPVLRVLLVTDLDGYLEPCGCTSRPLGGIDRMSARVRALAAEGVPTVTVAAGNLFFHGAPHGADAERAEVQERLRAETLTGILERVGLTAAVPGPLDFGYGTERFEALAQASSFPLLAQVERTHTPEGDEASAPETDAFFVPSVTRQLGPLTVGILGLAQLEGPDGTLPDGLSAGDGDLIAAGQREADALREAGADVVIALVTADRRTARRIASRVEAVDVVVHGGVDEADVGPPSEIDAAALVSAGRQGQGLVVLDLWPEDGSDRWVDVSAWTRESQRTHLTGQITSLETRIAEWETSGANASDLDAQRARLVELRRERAGLLAAPSFEGAQAFRARYEELPPEAGRDSAVTERMAALDVRVNDHNREAFADWTPEPAAEGQPHYVGAEACSTCHTAAFRWWRGHNHGRAYATLEDQHKNYNLSCVGCHVTGYLQPGGSTVTHVENLQDVGCETCHGPGSQHVSNPTGAEVNVARDAPSRLCVRCHNEEHSDTFDYDSYRARLLVPGHGQPIQ